jgi:hypothetical protein
MRKKMLPSCPWYSCTSSTPWRGRTPHLIVARSNVHTFTRSHVHTFTRSHVHTFTRSHVHTFTRSQRFLSQNFHEEICKYQ